MRDGLGVSLGGQEFKERPVSEAVFFLSSFSPLPSRKGREGGVMRLGFVGLPAQTHKPQSLLRLKQQKLIVSRLWSLTSRYPWGRFPRSPLSLACTRLPSCCVLTRSSLCVSPYLHSNFFFFLGHRFYQIRAHLNDLILTEITSFKAPSPNPVTFSIEMWGKGDTDQPITPGKYNGVREKQGGKQRWDFTNGPSLQRPAETEVRAEGGFETLKRRAQVWGGP